MNNATNMLSSVIPSHTQATTVDTSIDLAWTVIDPYTTEAINSHTKYDMLLLAVGAYDSPSGQEAFGFDFARVTRSPEVIKTSSSMRDPYIVTGTVDATAEAEGITVNADVKNEETAEAYAYVFAETGDRVLNIMERLDYIKDPTKTNAVVRVTIPNTGTSTIDGTALANVVEYESGDIVPASTVDAAHVYVVGSDQANSADVRNFGAKFDGQTYEIVAADDNPHVTMGEVTDPDSLTSGLIVHSGTVFSSKESIAGYYVFSFVTDAPTGNDFVEPKYLTEANVGTFFKDVVLASGEPPTSDRTYHTGIFGAGGKNTVWYDATNVPPRYQVGYIQTDRQIQRAFNALNATSMVDVTNASGWSFTPVILAVDTAARYGLSVMKSMIKSIKYRVTMTPWDDMTFFRGTELAFTSEFIEPTEPYMDKLNGATITPSSYSQLIDFSTHQMYVTSTNAPRVIEYTYSVPIPLQQVYVGSTDIWPMNNMASYDKTISIEYWNGSAYQPHSIIDWVNLPDADGVTKAMTADGYYPWIRQNWKDVVLDGFDTPRKQQYPLIGYFGKQILRYNGTHWYHYTAYGDDNSPNWPKGGFY